VEDLTIKEVAINLKRFNQIAQGYVNFACPTKIDKIFLANLKIDAFLS
jgi:hypothetical protein